MENSYSIGKVVKELNINKETVRYYEKIGLLDKPKRDKNGYRLYSKEDMDKIRFILIAKDFGFSLKEIDVLLSKIYDEILYGDINSIKKIVESKIDEIDSKINELDKTKKLLQKVNEDILNNKNKCCEDIDDYLIYRKI